MADMALDLAKKAVEGTVSRVLSAIDEDTKLKAAVKQDLRFIVREFQMMESFFEMANDNKKRTSNKVVKTWVWQLREQAFDVEDCVEFVIHVDTTSARVRWLSWLWRLVPLPFCMTPAWVQDLNRAFAQLKQIKAGVEEVSQRYTRYNLLGGDDSGSSTTPSPVPQEQAPEHLEAAYFPSTVDILRDLWKAHAKQSTSTKCNLQYLVTDGPSNELRVISVWRSAGVDHLEAAHILNTSYRDPEICKEFKARAMVKLMHPFNIQEFLKTLLNQLYVTSCQLDTLGADLLHTNGDTVIQDELRKLLRKHKYLIILEDLSSMVEWDLIKSYLPDLRNGSRIVISLEQLGFALSCAGEAYRVVQLALFPNDRYIYAVYKSSGICIKDLVRQLGQRRVVSLWGDEGGDTSSLVRDVYEAIWHDTAKFEGVNFEGFKRVNVPSPFSLEDFCWRLPNEFASDGHRDPNSYFAGFWRNQVCESRCLFVIEGLQSKEDWDLLKCAGLVPEDTRSCIVIIANEEDVAKHCEDHSWRKMDSKEQEEANNAAIIGPLFALEDQYYSWGHHDRFGNHGCSRRMEEALFQFGPFITPEQSLLLHSLSYHSPYLNPVNVVWGATGVGKSALIRLFYYIQMAYSLETITEDELEQWGLLAATRYERLGWVDVPEPFDLAELSRRLLLDFNSNDPGEMEKTAVDLIQGHNPIQRCCETVRNHKCLVVIDGLRSIRDWDSIKQNVWCHHHRRSRIIGITTDESIAKHLNNENGIFRMKALADKSALELFKQVAKKSLERDDELKTKFRIVPKCGGLPKIIDSVAKSNRSFWENINDDLVTKLKNDPQFDHLRGVLSWMHSYFDGCPDSVKPCVFYLSIFPTNYKIRKAHLLRRWITEGYSRGTSGSSAKENAETLFSELVKLEMIQKLPGMPLCQISGFFREYIISQPMEDNLVLALEGNCKPKSQHTVQHLSITKDWEREHKNVFESIDVSWLRSLTVYGKWQNFFVFDDKMKRIRVLDLEGTSGLEDDELKRIFGILLTLKFISLRGCKSITCLPKTLGGLRQLESLDVRGTSIVTLPQTTTKLKKIQYIRAGRMFLPFEDWTSAAAEDDSDDANGSQPSGTTPTPTTIEGTINEGPRQAPTAIQGTTTSEGPPQAPISQDKEVDGERKKKLVGRCWTSTKSLLFRHNNNNNNGGVEVPQGIEKMPALHTLGTVNINSACGKDFLTKLKDKTKFQQLLKLSVCGINKKNWKDLCIALSAHHHLESLSLGLDEDFTEGFDNPPKALRSLKLYGNIPRLPAWPWIKDRRLQAANLEKFDLEVIISSQVDRNQLVQSLPRILRRLCIKVTDQVRQLIFKDDYRLGITPQVLKIDCRSKLDVHFNSTHSIATNVNVLVIHCSKGSDFRISSVYFKSLGLPHLDTVWLKGYDEEAEYVAHLKEQIAKHPNNPDFKFEKLKSA